MANPFLGQITMFGGNFAPQGWAFCNGDLLPIQQYSALFSLLGTYYGGDGQTTFGLPDLRSRLPVHQGQGPGLSSYAMGQQGGSDTITIDQSTMPTHSHTFNASSANATAAAIGTTVLPAVPTVSGGYAYVGATTVIPQTLATLACSAIGGNQPHDNLMPSLCVTFIIALQGIYPSRN